MHLGELVIRVLGPLLFAAAFVVFIINYDVTSEYITLTKEQFADGEVYAQNDIDPDNDVFAFDDSSDYEVSGQYLLGVLSSKITERTIVVGNSYDYYQKLVIDPSLIENTLCFTAYHDGVSMGTTGVEIPVNSGQWVAGQSFNLEWIVDCRESVCYAVHIEYTPAGSVKEVTYTKKPKLNGRM